MSEQTPHPDGPAPDPEPHAPDPEPQTRPQQQLPYPPHPPYGSYAPPFNLYAILSLIISLVVFPPVGIYLGYKAKQQIEQTGERGIELAQVGIIVGWIFTALYGLFFICFCGAILMGMGSASFNGRWE